MDSTLILYPCQVLAFNQGKYSLFGTNGTGKTRNTRWPQRRYPQRIQQSTRPKQGGRASAPKTRVGPSPLRNKGGPQPTWKQGSAPGPPETSLGPSQPETRVDPGLPKLGPAHRKQGAGRAPGHQFPVRDSISTTSCADSSAGRATRVSMRTREKDIFGRGLRTAKSDSPVVLRRNPNRILPPPDYGITATTSVPENVWPSSSVPASVSSTVGGEAIPFTSPI